MARRIIWTNRAQKDRKEIFQFWNKRNKSNTYSKKLNKAFVEAALILSIHPQTGKLSEIEGVRIKIVYHFFLFFEYTETTLSILSIFDSRQEQYKL